MKFKISVVASIRDNQPTDVTLSYDELVNALTTFPTIVKPKDQCRGFIAGHFGKSQRLTANLISRTLITLDLDHYNSDLTSLKALLKRDLYDQWYIAYSTSSHTLKRPKIRVVVLLEKDIPVEQYRTVVLNFVDTLELKPFLDIDSSTKPNQLMFLPNKSNESYINWSFVNEGELLNPDYYCVDYGFTNLSDDNQGLTNIKDKKVKSIDKSVNLDNMILTIKNQPLDLTYKQIKDTLAEYKSQNTDYNAWIEVGLALSHQYKGLIAGAQIWYDWTKLDPREDHKHRLGKIKAKWASFGETSNPIKFSTIMKKAQEGKIKNMNTKVSENKAISGNVKRHKFIHTKGENLTPLNTLENFMVLINEYNISIKFDVILKCTEILFDGILERDLNSAQTRIESLCVQNGMPLVSVGKYIGVVKTETNSWKKWILSLPWDGQDRLSELYNTVHVAPEYEDTKRAYLKAWFMQMIHLSCLNDGENGKMGRSVLVFQGDQRVGKTSWFKALCPKTHQKYLQEGMMLDTKDSMSVLGCIQNVFVELGELGSTFKKSDSDNLKNFISSTTDLVNVKYVANHVSYRRRTVFFASINDHVFLQDTTGNTRYLILPVLKCDYNHDIDMQQLYAQLYSMAVNREGYELDNESLIKQKDLNSEFENPSYLEEKFSSVFNTELESRSNLLNIPSILELLGFLPGSIKQSHMTEMSRILKNLGYTRRTNKPRHWQLPPRR